MTQVDVRAAQAEALRDAADPMSILKWAEGPCENGLSVAAVNRYLMDRAAELGSPSRTPLDELRASLEVLMQDAERSTSPTDRAWAGLLGTILRRSFAEATR